MWLLTCPEILGSTDARWLRPGASYHIGRAPLKEDGGKPELQNAHNILTTLNTVSRAHIVIHVGLVKAEWCTSKEHSLLSFHDVGSRRGSVIKHSDGEVENKIQGHQSFAVSNPKITKIEVWLGNCAYPLRMEWRPICFTFSLSTKERKEGKIMAAWREKMTKLDIKTVDKYTELTTHSVASKRNTSIGLQALVNGKYVVTDRYLDMVVAAAAAPPGGISLLEECFEKNWPDPMEFVPPPSNEPVKRDASLFKPNPERRTVFEGIQFVVCDQTQYDAFLGPVSDGGGKLHRFWVRDKTTPEQVVDFVKEHDGILLAWRAKNSQRDDDLMKECSMLLGYKLLEQNEFLDVIMTCDTSTLRKPIESVGQSMQIDSVQVSRIPETPREREVPAPASVPEGSAPPSIEVSLPNAQQSEESIPSQPASSAPSSRPAARRRRGVTALLDDFFSTPAEDASPVIPSSPPAEEPSSNTRRSRLNPFDFDPTSSQAIPDSHDEQPPPRRQRSSSKRPAPESDEEDLMQIAPAAAAKRRKLEEERLRNGGGEDVDMEDEGGKEPEVIETTPPPELVPKRGSKRSQATAAKTATTKARTTKSKFNETEREVLEASRTLLAESTQAAASSSTQRRPRSPSPTSRSPSPSRHDAVDEIPPSTVESLRSLAIVELVPLRPRTEKPPPKSLEARWNPAWNGRSNFKGFRPAVKNGLTTRRAGGRLMIEMMPVDAGGKRAGGGRDDSVGAGGASSGSDSEDEILRFNSQARRTPAPKVTTVTRARPKVGIDPTQTQSQATPLAGRTGGRQSTLTTTVVGRKRGAAGAGMEDEDDGAGRPAVGVRKVSVGKKVRVMESDGEDSDDGMKFRFKKK